MNIDNSRLKESNTTNSNGNDYMTLEDRVLHILFMNVYFKQNHSILKILSYLMAYEFDIYL